MIKSNQFQVPNNEGQFGSVTSLQNALVDSGVRIGVNIWNIYINVPLVASNSVSVIVNGTTITQAFDTDNANSLDDLVASIEALDSVVTCTWETSNVFVDDVNYGFKVIITGVENAQLVIGTLTITGGATQPKFFLKEDNFLKILPGLVVVNQDAIEANRVDVVSATVTYTGYALPGSDNDFPVWRITRATIASNVTSIEYADGNAQFDNVWADRASLTYS